MISIPQPTTQTHNQQAQAGLLLGAHLTSYEDKQAGLDDSPFSYRESRDGKVFISWCGRRVMTLKGRKAESFRIRLSRLDGPEQQVAMARITGNFKRGNDR